MATVRLFAGVALDPLLRAALACLRETVSAVDEQWATEKWVVPQNLHLTLAFFGSVDEASVDGLSEAIHAVCADAHAFSLPLRGVASSPNDRRARMLWARFDDPQSLAGQLSRSIEDAAAVVGHEPESRTYAPHVTLCRLRRQRAVSPQVRAVLDAAARGAPPSMSVREVTLFASRLAPSGPHYSVVGSWCLRGE